jgi:hypothetical protein
MLDLHNTDLTLMAGVEKARREKIAEMIRSEQDLMEIKPRKAGLRDHILAAVGSAMISIGEWMQERSVLVLSHSAGTNQPDC